MFRFSLRTLLFAVVLAGIVCAVLFAFPPWLRVSVLFVGVLAIPGPLFVLYRNGRANGKSFALGGLTAYAAWFTVVGVPSGFGIVTASMQTNIGRVLDFANQPASDTIGQGLNVSGYVFFAFLYAPWIIVAIAGLTTLMICWFAGIVEEN